MSQNNGIKLIVAGGRDFVEDEIVGRILQSEIIAHNIVVELIIAGGARGVDTSAVRFPIKQGIPFREYSVGPEEWKMYGPYAGPRRNSIMAQAGDYLIAFWDGQSKGTDNMIKEMRKLGKPVIIIDICNLWMYGEQLD